MDKTPAPGPGEQPTQWGPKPGGIILCAAAGLVFVGAAVGVVSDGPGRFLAGVAGLGLLIFALVSWRSQPKLRLDSDGLTLGGVTGMRSIPRQQVQSVCASDFRRLGRRAHLLEIDTDEQLIVLNRWDLGTDPRDVFEVLRAAGYPAKNR